MKANWLLCVMLFCTTATQAQWDIRTIALNPDDDFYAYRFPYVQGRDSVVAKKINAYLQVQILYQQAVSVNPKQIFEEARYNDSIQQTGYTSIHYSIGLNNKKVLSIRFDMETMAAYPEYYADYYNFDSRTGEIINVNEIFTQEGIKYLSRSILKQRRQIVKQFISKEYLHSEDSAYIREQYATCLQENELGEIFIQPHDVLFHIGYCFPHVGRPYDTDLDVRFSLKQLQPYLLTYGKELLLTRD